MNGISSGIYHEKQVKELCALHALNNLFQSRYAFTKAVLDEICESLSPHVWINPHKSLLGLGNYDVNVIMSALQKKGCEAIWFDKRKHPDFSTNLENNAYCTRLTSQAVIPDPKLVYGVGTSRHLYFSMLYTIRSLPNDMKSPAHLSRSLAPECLELAHIKGFILNVPSDYRLGFVLLPLKKRHWVAIRRVSGIYYNLDSKLDAPHAIGQEADLMHYLKEQLDSKEKELFIVVSREVEEKHLWEKEEIIDR